MISPRSERLDQLRQICSKVYSIQRFSEDEDVAVTRTHSGIDSLLNVSCPANPEILLTNGIDKRVDDECLLTGFVFRKSDTSTYTKVRSMGHDAIR
jgi:hypothetical protein